MSANIMHLSNHPLAQLVATQTRESARASTVCMPAQPRMLLYHDRVHNYNGLYLARCARRERGPGREATQYDRCAERDAHTVSRTGTESLEAEHSELPAVCYTQSAIRNKIPCLCQP